MSEKIRSQAGQPRVKVVLGAAASAKSRHLSIGIRPIFWFLSGVAVVLLTLGFLAGDYLQLEILRARDFIAIKALELDRARFQDRLNKLESKRRELQKINIELAASKAELESRLDEIAGVLSGIDVLDLGAKPTKNSKRQDSVGGAESACSAPKGDCLGKKAQVKKETASATPKISWESKRSAIRYLPIGLPSRGRITSRFGARISPFSGRQVFHEGIDFSLPHGSLVKTSGDGVVTKAEWHSTYGLVVEVEHTKGITSRYAHLSRSRVKKGDIVTRGQIIAYSGSSGRSTGPHLHYEVLARGRAVDPIKYLALGQSLVRVALKSDANLVSSRS